MLLYLWGKVPTHLVPLNTCGGVIMSENQIIEKKCSLCKKIKPVSGFWKHKNNKDRYQDRCITCIKKDQKGNKDKIAKRQSEYYKKNKHKIKEKRVEYYKENKERISAYHMKNKKKFNKKSREYNRINKEEITKKRAAYQKNKMATDPLYRLERNLRRRISVAIKRQFSEKAYSSIELLGCTPIEARTHIERQFKKGMNWNNHGEWEIDHRIPCASFDLSDPEEQKTCFHYMNLQPLWKKENSEKRDKMLYLL